MVLTTHRPTFTHVQTLDPAAIADPTEAAMRAYYSSPVDLANCEHEPLHLIQVIQPHACLLVVDRKSFRIEVASENTGEHIGRTWRELLGQPLDTCLEEATVAQVKRAIDADIDQSRPLFAFFMIAGETEGRQVIYHSTKDKIVLEIEPVQEGFETSIFQQRLGEAIEQVQHLTDYSTMFGEIAKVVARISGYDRVSLYRFDADWNGEVVAEVLNREGLESWLNLRYPASDIPAQARDLYLRNRVRMLSDINADQVFLRKHADGNPKPQALDLSAVDCRGLSPVHREYLQNIGVAATMSIAVILDGKLWGLFALHHDTPRYLDFELRSFLKFVGQVFSGHLSLQSASEYRRRVLEVNSYRSQLGDQISELNDIGLALTEGTVTVLDLIPKAHGAAVSVEGAVSTIGACPPDDENRAFADWVRKAADDPLVYHHNCLKAVYPRVAELGHGIAGALLVWLDKDRSEYLAWFRQEIVRNVHWGGKPGKLEVETSDGGVRFAPRKSFAKYTETVRDHSDPWTESDVDAALALRSHIKDVVLRRYQHVRRVNSELASAYKEMETFSYTVSHDLRAPLRGINGFAEILLEDYADKLDEDARMMLRRIQSSTTKMNLFIDDLLQLAKLGVSAPHLHRLDLGAMARECFEDTSSGYRKRSINFEVADGIPEVMADGRLMGIALNNLISNAIKYSQHNDHTEITFGYDPDSARGRGAFYLKDNGEGFEPRYAERVFEMFTRLSEDATIEGSGIGLALVQRVIEKHNGSVWVESEPNVGTTFYFTLQSA